MWKSGNNIETYKNRVTVAKMKLQSASIISPPVPVATPRPAPVPSSIAILSASIAMSVPVASVISARSRSGPRSVSSPSFSVFASTPFARRRRLSSSFSDWRLRSLNWSLLLLLYRRVLLHQFFVNFNLFNNHSVSETYNQSKRHDILESVREFLERAYHTSPISS